MTIKLISNKKEPSNSNSRPQIFDDMKRYSKTPHNEARARCRKFLKSLSDDGFDELSILHAVLDELEANAVTLQEIEDFKWSTYSKYKRWKDYKPTL